MVVSLRGFYVERFVVETIDQISRGNALGTWVRFRVTSIGMMAESSRDGDIARQRGIRRLAIS